MKPVLNGSGCLVASGLIFSILLGVAGIVSFRDAATFSRQVLVFGVIIISVASIYGLLVVIFSKIRRY